MSSVASSANLSQQPQTMSQNRKAGSRNMPAVNIYRPPGARHADGDGEGGATSKSASRQRRPDLQVYVPRARRVASDGPPPSTAVTEPPQPPGPPNPPPPNKSSRLRRSSPSVVTPRKKSHKPAECPFTLASGMRSPSCESDISGCCDSELNRTKVQICQDQALPTTTVSIEQGVECENMKTSPCEPFYDAVEEITPQEQILEPHGKIAESIEINELVCEIESNKNEGSWENMDSSPIIEKQDASPTYNSSSVACVDKDGVAVMEDLDSLRTEKQDAQDMGSSPSSTPLDTDSIAIVEDLDNSLEGKVLDSPVSLDSSPVDTDAGALEVLDVNSASRTEVTDTPVSSILEVDNPSSSVQVDMGSSAVSADTDSSPITTVDCMKSSTDRAIAESANLESSPANSEVSSREIQRRDSTPVLVISTAQISLPRPPSPPTETPPVSQAPSKVAKSSKKPTLRAEECSWDVLFDDNGDCLEPSIMEELTRAAGRVRVSVPSSDYSAYESARELMLAERDYPHVLEIHGFSAEFKTQDLLAVLAPLAGTAGCDLKWVDDTHALAVFSNSQIAAEVLALRHPLLQARPLSQATPESKQKARRSAGFLQPYRPRPETCTALAKRMVSSALGVRLHTTKEERERERTLLREAREKKRLAAKQSEEAWEGKISSK